LGATLVVASATRATVMQYGCVLSGQQETPAIASNGMGGGTFLIDTDANTMTYRIVFTGLTGTETAAHIHGYAAAGTPAGVVHALPAGNPKVGVWNYNEVDETSILNGLTYVNVHSTSFGGGEIRGQIVPLNASLDGAQETPAVATTAKGFGVFTIDTAANALNYYVVFSGLGSAETAAHIHGAASSIHGTPAGVLVGLPAGSPKVGTWNYPESAEELILSGRTYVNIHSASFGGGEIRGQITPFVVPMDSQQEAPPVTSPTAAGVALLSWRSETNELGFDVRYAGLSSAETQAHIHGFAPPGEGAGVLMALPLGPQKIGVWNYGQLSEPDVMAGLAYFNVHSSTSPGGEIRGQIADFHLRPVVSVPGQIAPMLPLVGTYPNPFRAGTTIRFTLEREAKVSLTIYDSVGREVRALASGVFGSGEHPVAWDGRDGAGNLVPNGVYHYVVETSAGRFADQITVIR